MGLEACHGGNAVRPFSVASFFLKDVFVSEHAVQGFGDVRRDGPRPIGYLPLWHVRPGGDVYTQTISLSSLSPPAFWFPESGRASFRPTGAL